MMLILLVSNPPNVTVSPSVTQGIVGSAQTIECIAITNVTLGFDSVDFMWIAPNGSSIVNDSRLSISQISSNADSNYTTSLIFDYLMEGDQGTYICNVTTTLFNASASDSTMVPTLTSE